MFISPRYLLGLLEYLTPNSLEIYKQDVLGVFLLKNTVDLSKLIHCPETILYSYKIFFKIVTPLESLHQIENYHPQRVNVIFGVHSCFLWLNC